MTDEEIHNIYLHMSGKAEGLVEATGKADFPVLFARAILEYEGLTKDVQNMASKSTYKEQLETNEYERGFIDGMQKQMQSSVDKAVNAMSKREWVELKDEPVAWGMETDGLIYDVICPAEHEREEGEYTIPLYTTPQLETKDEPVAWMTENKYLITQDENLAKKIKEQGDEPIIPLYTTPQRTWVGLTDEEIQECLQGLPTQTIDVYARRIEIKIKEKNT